MTAEELRRNLKTFASSRVIDTGKTVFMVRDGLVKCAPPYLSEEFMCLVEQFSNHKSVEYRLERIKTSIDFEKQQDIGWRKVDEFIDDYHHRSDILKSIQESITLWDTMKSCKD